MSSCKPNDFYLKCIIIIHLSKTKVSSTAQQLHSHSRSSGWPAKGQSWALHPGSQGVEESFPRDALPRTPRVGDGFWDPPKPNGLGNPTWRHNIIDIIWYLLIYVLFRGYQVVLHQVSHHVTSAKCENRNVHLRKKTLNYCKTYIFSACVHKSCVYLSFLKVSLVLVSYLCFFKK